MSESNQKINLAVWFDTYVIDLDRAVKFYTAVLNTKIELNEYQGVKFGVFVHEDGVGGCLVPAADKVSDKGSLVYLNVDGRIKDALEQSKKFGGKVIEEIQSIGPHGFRAIILDSEGNRLALHAKG